MRTNNIELTVVNPIVGVTEIMPVLAVTRIGRYYRTTVPREVRKLLGINENDLIEWVFEDGKIIIRKVSGEKCERTI